ncbi:MAG TPA: metalloregulator ArsR/SmtB family transcription factor [Anaerolineales bacterium]|nr:metalloregulator ArsR/SmtB family transcription factor [Anaerolineales bacterium]
MSPSSGLDLLEVLSALANPHRLQIITALVNETNYVSQLAREIGISRPLLIMHLKKLEDAGLVTSRLELSEDGKAMRFYEVADFDIPLSPRFISGIYKE